MLWSSGASTAPPEAWMIRTWQDALKIILAQCLAIPGVLHAWVQRLSAVCCSVYRASATESFFPRHANHGGAAVYPATSKPRPEGQQHLPVFAIGFVTAIFAMIAACSRFIAKHSYAVFARYRIGFACLSRDLAVAMDRLEHGAALSFKLHWQINTGCAFIIVVSS
jgi:undecaprenyl pyrophosphate phosphatase UppP